MLPCVGGISERINLREEVGGTTAIGSDISKRGGLSISSCGASSRLGAGSSSVDLARSEISVAGLFVVSGSDAAGSDTRNELGAGSGSKLTNGDAPNEKSDALMLSSSDFRTCGVVVRVACESGRRSPRVSDRISMSPDGFDAERLSFRTKISSHREQWNLGVSRAATAAVSTANLVRQEGQATTICGGEDSKVV